MSNITLGELMSGRRLRKQEEPVQRYIPGQYKAKMMSDTDAIVTYVDLDGGLCMLPVEWVEEAQWWTHRRVMVRYTFKMADVRVRPVGGHLQAEIINAIKAAETARQERKNS